MKKTMLKYILKRIADTAVLVLLFVLCAFWYGADFSNKNFLAQIGIGCIFVCITYVVFSHLFKTYRVIWSYARADDIIHAAEAIFFSELMAYLFDFSFGNVFLNEKIKMASGASFSNIYFLKLHITHGLFFLLYFFITRVILFFHGRKKETIKNMSNEENIPTMIIGAGEAAHILIHELITNKDTQPYLPVCVIDDEPSKLNMFFDGVKIVGNRNDIEENVKEYGIKTIIFAIPSCSAEQKAEILNICAKTDCEVKSMPLASAFLDSKGTQEGYVNRIKKVEIEDLLGRETIKMNLENVMDYVKGKVVMVTGGGGSIGSELCRQIAAYSPKQLIIFDIYENNAYDIQNELKRKYPMLNLVTLIGSVRDVERLDQVFGKYKPEIVYHAAAHKHVPLMEDSPNEAIKNNVFGTFNTVQMADKHRVKRFVMISTDKAVNPTNVMGATKRICEMIIQSYNRFSDTEYVAVRFGNVLGSNGSVIPLFKRQLSEGGPITVTHPDIIRYFMTIPEAVSLVLQAGAAAKGGEIFVLDMGKPVRILDLAENLIRLSGFKPYEDIEIKFTGLRPGEKLYEELLMDEEGLKDTENKLIHIGKPIVFNEEDFYDALHRLKHKVYDDDCDVRAFIKEIVSTYHPGSIG